MNEHETQFVQASALVCPAARDKAVVMTRNQH